LNSGAINYRFGGGTPVMPIIMLLKADNVVSIYLKASIETLFKRLSANKSRPSSPTK
jgi:shikimate kinase